MKDKKKKSIFLCEITEKGLRLIKCIQANNVKREFVGLEEEATENVSQAFKKLGYNNNPVIISLPRHQATCRYLKIPALLPQEIERIISLQAPRYLPYPANELITGYQIISSDREGYSNINLVIVHKNVIERYLNILRGLNIKNLKIILNSFGLCNLYNYIEPMVTQPVMIIDVNFPYVEVALFSQDKLLFSRSFKITQQEESWQHLLLEEIKKTKDVYLKEISPQEPIKAVIVGSANNSQKVKEILSKYLNLPVEILPYWEKVSCSGDLANKLLSIDNSLAGVIGLGLKELPPSLNLLPPSIKNELKKLSQRKEVIRLTLLTAGAILILGLGIAKNLDNKSNYLKQLKIELKKIENEARPLEELEKRFKFIENHIEKKPSSLDILYEIHQIMPQQISLINFNYEKENQVTLHGQTTELNSVFAFVTQLEKSKVFKGFNIKVRYATKKRIQVGEIVDFEIVCIKK